MPAVKLQVASTPDRVRVTFENSKTEIANKIGIRGLGKLDDKDEKKIAEGMATAKKPAEYYIDFDGEWFTLFVAVAKKTAWKSTLRLSSDASIKDVDKVLKSLVTYGAATAAHVKAYRKANPDKKAVDEIKKQIAECLKEIKEDQARLNELKKQYKELIGA